ncbi:MAG: SMC-Scp complex subunit ScpB [Deltaproteobacteria bacterium]|nr:MAG: SMC-Scp complex subunit ScpB [Deltaproteobacteria bacterium]
MNTDEIKAVIESLIFVSENALSVDEIKKVLEGEEKSRLKQALDELVAEYGQMDRSFSLQEVAGGYQFRTKPKFASWIKKLNRTRPTRLTQPALETLAIIAYKQPILRSEIERIRGVDTGGVINTLLLRKLIKIMGRKDGPGRPLIYGTTQEFLETFGLKNISELPTLRELKGLGGEEPEE